MQKPASLTLPDLIEELAAQYPDRPAATFEQCTISFAQFRERVVAFAKALHADGVRAGDKVAILMGNRIEWLIVNFAIQYLGATTVAINTWYTARELTYVLDHGDVSVLVCVDRFLRTDYAALLAELRPFASHVPQLRRIVMLGDASLPEAVGYDRFLTRGAAIPDAAIVAAARGVTATHIAYLLYTSGSTARPKGVLLEHGRLIENMFEIGERLHFTDRDTLYLPISLFWALGCENMLIASWTHGMHIVLQAQFDPGDALHLIELHRCTALCGTANIIEAIFSHPDLVHRNIASLRKGIAAASPETTRRVIATMLPLACHSYGLTESYGLATVNDASDPPEKRATTEGRPLPGTEVVIVVPESGQPVPTGSVGEIRLRGHVSEGYYKNPAANGDAFDRNGYFRTGDLGAFDPDGYLLFKGRLKEMLKTGGMNVAPMEVEEVLRSHPAIREAFVTGVPDPIRDEAVAAIIVLHDGVTLADDAIVAYCRHLLAAYKVPRQIHFATLADIPLTTTGKVHRARLSELFKNRPL